MHCHFLASRHYVQAPSWSPKQTYGMYIVFGNACAACRGAHTLNLLTAAPDQNTNLHASSWCQPKSSIAPRVNFAAYYLIIRHEHQQQSWSWSCIVWICCKQALLLLVPSWCATAEASFQHKQQHAQLQQVK